MRTIERTAGDVAAPVRRSTNAWLYGAVALLALLIGVVAGWQIFASEVEVIRAGGGELTAREQQMVDMVEEYRQAWVDADGQAVAAFFTSNGSVTIGAAEYRIDDGSLANLVNTRSSWPIEFQDPSLVRGNQFLAFHSHRGAVLADWITFTSAGDLRIVSHVMR